MADLIDVLSETGLRTGEILPRSEIHRLGKCHRAIHLYLFNSRNELLVQRRALTVDHYPGVFSASVLGHVNAGESSSETARRELMEELGIAADDLKIDFLFSYFSEETLNENYIDRQFNDIYLTRSDVELERIRFDPAEVAEVKFVQFETFQELFFKASPALANNYRHEFRDLAYFLDGQK